MLTRPLQPVPGLPFLRFCGGDTIRADELRMRAGGSFLAFIMISYIPLIAAVALLIMTRPQPVNEATQRDQLTAIEAYATRYVDTYLKDPSNTAAIKQFYDGDVPPSALPAGGRALRAASCLPGVFKDGFQTYSAVLTPRFPKAANAASMVRGKAASRHLSRSPQSVPRFHASACTPGPPTGHLGTAGHPDDGLRGPAGVQDRFRIPQRDADRTGRAGAICGRRLHLYRRAAAPLYHDGDRAHADQFRGRDCARCAAKSRRCRGHRSGRHADRQRRADADGFSARHIGGWPATGKSTGSTMHPASSRPHSQDLRAPVDDDFDNHDTRPIHHGCTPPNTPEGS